MYVFALRYYIVRSIVTRKSSTFYSSSSSSTSSSSTSPSSSCLLSRISNWSSAWKRKFIMYLCNRARGSEPRVFIPQVYTGTWCIPQVVNSTVIIRITALRVRRQRYPQRVIKDRNTVYTRFTYLHRHLLFVFMYIFYFTHLTCFSTRQRFIKCVRT